MYKEYKNADARYYFCSHHNMDVSHHMNKKHEYFSFDAKGVFLYHKTGRFTKEYHNNNRLMKYIYLFSQIYASTSSKRNIKNIAKGNLENV